MTNNCNTTDLYGGEYDSEDDEGFFLTPVLHYDISNKIKEANKLLFDEGQSQVNANEEKTSVENRRVTFANELVSYAPNPQLPAVATTDDDDDEEETSIKEELDINVEVSTAHLETTEKLSELNEILDKIDNNMMLEQHNVPAQRNTLDVLEETNNKSLLELDPPYLTTLKHANKETSPEQQGNNNSNTNADYAFEVKDQMNLYESDGDDSISMLVGTVARKQIRDEIKQKKSKVNILTNKRAVLPDVTKDHTKYHMNRKRTNVPNFNYKTCCEFQQTHLPQYKGHISEYGLTLMDKERMLQLHKRQERNLVEHKTRLQNETARRLTANEQAFSTWLVNKCRNAPNRTRNMFDCKPITSKRKTIDLQMNEKVEKNLS